jgi:GAF domain-containing protein
MSSPLDRYAHEAADRLGGPVFCSLTLSERGSLHQVASSDPRAAACDQVETRDGEGPCILAMDQLRSVLLDDLDAGTRWPGWRQVARDHGFRSFVAFPAYVDDDLTVALNVYSEELATWTEAELVAMDVYVQRLAGELRTRGDHPVGEP